MVNELLSKGKDNAITTVALMNACHFKSKRELTKQIARERAAGVLICSTSTGQGGYYLPESREEFINSMSSRAKNTFKAVKAARAYLKQIDGQQVLDLTEKGR